MRCRQTPLPDPPQRRAPQPVAGRDHARPLPHDGITGDEAAAAACGAQPAGHAPLARAVLEPEAARQGRAVRDP